MLSESIRSEWCHTFKYGEFDVKDKECSSNLKVPEDKELEEFGEDLYHSKKILHLH